MAKDPTPPPRVLFLTSKLGYGHTRAADAIRHALLIRMPRVECRYLDLWSLVDSRVAAAVKDGYLRMTRDYPDYYQRLYDLDRGLWRQLSGEEAAEEPIRRFMSTQKRRWFPPDENLFSSQGRNVDRALLSSLITLMCRDEGMPSQKIVMRSLLLLMRSVLLNRMKERIQQFSPQVIVATQMYPAALVSQLKQRRHFRRIPTLGILTDYGLQSVWVKPPSDQYCVGCVDLYRQLAEWGVSERRIHCTGIPLMPQFNRPPTMDAARRRLQIPPERRTVLITGGQYGIGIVNAVSDLVRERQDYQILVVAGRAPGETAELEVLARKYSGQVRVFEWVDDMSVLLAAADVVVGKPGGLSVSEALACGRPFYATCCLGGQERHNVNFLSRAGVGGVVAPSRLRAKLHQLFSAPGELMKLQERAFAHGHRHGAQKVAALIQQQMPTRHESHRKPHEHSHDYT